jgi:hypothetical protein
VGTSISVHEELVDTSEQVILDGAPKREARRLRSFEDLKTSGDEHIRFWKSGPPFRNGRGTLTPAEKK